MWNGAKAGKTWGITTPLLFKNNVEIHRIEARKGHHCSMHCHLHKYNAFYVEVGELHIVVRKNDYDLVDTTILYPGDYMVVPPGEYHRFEAKRDTIAFEFYWVELLTDDIVREDHGQ